MTRALVNILDEHDHDQLALDQERDMQHIDDVIRDLNDARRFGAEWVMTVTCPMAAKVIRALADELANLRNEFQLYISENKL